MKIFLDADSQMQIHIQMHIQTLSIWRANSLSNTTLIHSVFIFVLDNWENFQKNFTSRNSDNMGIRYACTKSKFYIIFAILTKIECASERIYPDLIITGTLSSFSSYIIRISFRKTLFQWILTSSEWDLLVQSRNFT